MKIEQVAAQLYTLRDHCKTSQDIATTLKKVRAIGYQAVQVSGMGPIDEAELVRMMEGEGLTCCATHEPTTTILEQPEAVVERLQKLGCRYTAVPHPGAIPLDSVDEVADFIKRMNHSGEVLARHNQVLTYHNHHSEFRKVGGRTLLEAFYSDSDPQLLQGELDTYWVQYGGGDVVGWIKRLNGRSPLLHLKDYAIDATNTPVFAEIGNGNLDWSQIIPAADAAGCEWFIVEQDTCPGDPFDSLRMSFEFLQGDCL